jgi:hypothetical protein
MKQEKISYKEIIKLGFTQEAVNDTVYFNEFGFDYAIIELKLTSKIFINWAKETQLCKMYRIDKKSKGNVLSRKCITSLKELKEIIKFFKNKLVS